MPKVTPLISNFTAGELSPLLDGRVDISKYYNGAKTLENFIILPTGGIKRRPGTYYVAEVKDSSVKTRLIPFQFSTTQTYIIEAGDKYFRFYQNRGQILSGGSAYELTTTYLEADLFDLQFAQDADTMWIVHPSYKPQKLTRVAATWDSETKLMLHCDGTDAATTFTDTATSKVMTANGNAQIDTAQYKFGGASGLFDGTGDYVSTPDHADWYFGTGNFTIETRVRFAALPSAGAVYDFIGQWATTGDQRAWRMGIFEASGVYTFDFEYSTAGTAATVSTLNTNITVAINTWYHFAIVRSGNNIYLFFNGIKVYTLDVTGADIFNSTAILSIGAENGTISFMNGWLDEIRVSKGIARWTTNFTPPTSAYAADVVTFALNNYAPTSDPFTSANNYPSCVSIHEQRIVFANTNDDPQKIWASVAGNLESMALGTQAAGDAYVYTIGSEQVNAIRWLSSGNELAMGTLGGVFTMSSGEEGVSITPANVVVKRETSYGSSKVVPRKIGDNIFYVQRNLKTIREFIGIALINTEGKLNESAFDATVLAEHITGLGVIDMDYQQSPYNILWCVTSDGYLACLTRQIEQEVLAWSRQIIGGSFGTGSSVVESVAVIPGDGGDDEAWFIVKRTINSVTKRYVEYLKPMDFGDEQEDGFFVDCGLTLDTPITITGITKANPGVVTALDHGFSNGNIVVIRGVKGMTEVNQIKFKVANKTTDTFQLTDPDDDTNINTSSYTTYNSAGEVRKCVTSVSGLSHLNGETVDVCVDGTEGAASAAVSGGAITVSTPSNGGGEIHAGLEYTSTIKSMRPEAGSQQGTAQSKLKRIAKTFVRIFESINLKVGNEDTQDIYNVSDPADNTDKPTPLRSKDIEVMMPSLWDRNGYIVIKQDKPLPLNILAIILYMTTSDA